MQKAGFVSGTVESALGSGDASAGWHSQRKSAVHLCEGKVIELLIDVCPTGLN